MQKSEEMRVKGSLVIDIVKAIRGFKDKPWDKYLTKEAQDLVSQRILHAVWYPAEPALCCLRAIYHLIGGDDPRMAKEWGRINGLRTFEETYKVLFSANGDTADTLKKLDTVASFSLFKGIRIESRQINKNHSQFSLFSEDPNTEPVMYFVQGWIEVLIEKTGGRNGKVKIIEKHWEGAKATVLDVKWE